MKTAKIYSSCVNTSAIDSRRSAPLEDLIEQYGGWTVSGKGLNFWTVEEKMGRIQRDLNVQTLLPVSVMTDLMDSSKHILKVSRFIRILMSKRVPLWHSSPHYSAVYLQ